MRMSSTFLVFDSQPNFRSNTNRFQFTDCCLQSRLNRRRCQIFLFGGDAAGLSIAIRYGASKSYAPTCNLATYYQILFVMASCCDYASKQEFEPNRIYGIFLFPLNVENFSLKNLGYLPFDQVISRLFMVSRILAQSTKI
jgi:hypothetical protein